MNFIQNEPGFVKIHRKILASPFSRNPNDLALAIYLIAIANWNPGRFQSKSGDIVDIPRGSLVTSSLELAKHFRMDRQKIRTSLKNLKKCNFLTITSTNHYTLIKIINYCKYQDYLKDANQHTNQHLTSTQPAPNHDIRSKERKNTDRAFVPPTLAEVTAYCQERKNSINPQYWIDYHEARGWKLKGNVGIKNWKAVIRTWEKNDFRGKTNEPAIPGLSDRYRPC